MTGPGYPVGTGEPVPPPNAPAARQLGIGVQPGTPNIIRAQLVIVSGPVAGVFVYSGTPSSSNPPIFWATSASTDPYGNAVSSTVGVAGAGTFEAGDTIIDSAGIFVYSSTPASGNLIASAAPAAGTDAFGNSYAQGLVAYHPGQSTYAQLLNAGLFLVDTATSATVELAQDLATGNALLLPGSAGSAPFLETVHPGGLTAEKPQIMPAMSNGWSVSGSAEYLFTGVGDLQVSFQALTPGTVTDNTTIWAAGSLPSAYRPPANHRVNAYCDALKVNGSTFETAALQFGTDGSVACFGIGTAATRVDLYATIPIRM